jgi:hypothetical protein
MKILRFLLVISLITANFFFPFAFSQTSKTVKVSDSTQLIESAKISAAETQQACLRFIKMNVFEFEDCINNRLHVKGISSSERLGITYMALVGAISGQRMGSQGSHMMSWEFAKKMQKIQKKFGLKDTDLCDIVPGDCQARIARVQLTLKQGKPKPLTEAELSSAHVHRH